MTPHPFVNRLATMYRHSRIILSRLSALIAPVWDEGLRLALWWGLLMLSTICVLELCRWFWLIYPETIIGKKYMSGVALPAFAETVLHEPHWYTALFLVTAPCLASLALALVSRFFYLKRLFYNPFGSILRTVVWAAPVAAWTGYQVMEYIGFTLESAVTFAAASSLAFIPQVFRTADRLCPEVGDCIRWLRRRLRRLAKKGRSQGCRSEQFEREGAHFF